MILLAAALLAGCIKVTVPSAPAASPSASAGPASSYPVACLVVDGNGTPLASATCSYRFGPLGADAPVNRSGVAVRSVPAGLSGTLTAAAPGRTSLQARLTIDGPKSVRFPLSLLPPGQHSGTLTTSLGPGASSTGSTGPDVPTVVLPQPRPWRTAVAVVDDGSGGEPQVMVAPDGTVYYSPLSHVYRSTDGGASFADATPQFPQGAPVSASDTAISVGPDGSLWFTDDWPYAGSTQACGSSDRGTTWTCDVAALPGATDRMWVAGLSASEAYLQTGEALEQPHWLHTTTGGQAWVPYATGILGQYGNMAYDAVHHAVWQVTGGTTQQVALVTAGGPTVSFRDTPVPGTYAIPWLAVANGTLWTTGEAGGKVVAARSTDQGATWQQFPVSQEPKMAAFSYIAADAHGRAAVVYYGSDKPADPPSNHGHWSLYVAETDDALAAQPTWVETRLVDGIHDGNLCIGLNCEQSNGDAQARMAGDLIGIALDRDGNAYVAYVRQAGGKFPNELLREG